jgi:hypothetical protein
MKPCRRNRKRIAWLAIGALEGPAARDLRAHLEVCEGCRRYFAEISNAAEILAATAITPDIETSESFHRRVSGVLKAEALPSRKRGMEFLRAVSLRWRVAAPALAAMVLGCAILSQFRHHANPSTFRPAVAPVTQPAYTRSETRPSIRNYQLAMNRSLDELDELLTKQAKSNPSFGPIYRASASALGDGPDH